MERDFELSTVGQPHMKPAWKQEVNRRLAAHRNRKGAEPAPSAPEQPHRLGSSRAAEAAARVAARYAKAPSYTEMQAEEARIAVRAAEIATQVALEAQAAAEDALAELHAAAQAPPMRGPAIVESIARVRAETAACAEGETAAEPAPKSPESGEFHLADALDSPGEAAPPPAVESRPVAIRWEPDVPVRVLDPRPAPQEDFQLSAEDWWTPAQEHASLRSEPITVDSGQAHANLIEFPRELVATRRMRPRLAEAPVASRPTEGQLSIFEVDPGAVSTEPNVSAATEEATSSGPRWSGMELDELPVSAHAPEPQIATGPRIDLAPLGLRLLASVVDSSLILAAFFVAATCVASRIPHPPVGRPAETLAVIGLVLAGILYHALAFALGLSTPGMRYAGIALSTFDDESPTRAQLRRRLSAMVVSLAPVGLGFAWSIFDDDHLSWHDRISQTYLRKR